MAIDKCRKRDYTNINNPENGTNGGDCVVYYPTLIGEMAKREIQKKALAQCIGVCDKALRNKLDGKAPFTWPEVKKSVTVFSRMLRPTNSLPRKKKSKTAREGGEEKWLK